MRAVLAAADQVAAIRPTRVGIDETVMTTGKLTARRREFLTALVCQETSLVVAVAQGRDRASAVRLLAAHAPDGDAKVVGFSPLRWGGQRRWRAGLGLGCLLA